MIQRLDGTTYNLDDLGIRVISFDPPSPNYQFTYTQIHETKATLTDTQIQQTTAPLVVQLKAKDVYDYELMRQRLLKIFASYESFYVINMRIPTIRWNVRAEAFDVPRLSNFWFTQPITINLDYPEGFAESVLNTSDDEFKVPNANLSLGLDIPRDKDISYHFSNQSDFEIWNLGHIPLKADERPVLFEFKGEVGSQLVIKNKTTNQTFEFNRSLNSGNSLQIYGMKPVVDGVSAFQDSNHEFLDLAVGKNDFSISGASNWSLYITTRFYY
nr:phage tail domain-containing protein [Companilactobacillus mishanensis]